MGKIVGFDIGENSVKMAYYAGKTLKKTVMAELPDAMVSQGRILSMDAMAENGFEPADNSPTPEAALLDRESTGDISRALDQLPADMRTVVILYALEKQRYEDLAQITGVSIGTVKSRLNRARLKLSAILANQREQNEKSSVLPSERRTGK